MLFQLIAPALLELLKDRRCPVGSIDLVAVVEESVWIGNVIVCKSLLETLQIVLHSLGIEMVDHPPFSTRCSPIHQLLGTCHIDGEDLPSALTILRFPCQHIVGYQACEILRWSLSIEPIGHHLMHPGSAPHIPSVFLCRRSHLQVRRRCKVQLDFWYSVHQLHQLAHTLHLHRIHSVHHPTGSLFQRHLWASERPTSTSVHIYLHAIAHALLFYIAQNLHPAWREELDVMRLVPFHPIDRRNLQRADAVAGILLHEFAELSFFYSTAHPPPAAARMGLDR